jgi:serine/threonine-protein kinase
VAYYLLTGQPVFAADSDVGVALAHVKDEPVRPSLRSEFDIPPALEAVILQCLAKEPAGRPRSAEEITRRLEAVQIADAWTRDKAHNWWELHRVALAPKGSTDLAAADPEGACAPGTNRCWPRLDPRPASTSSSVAR